MPIAKASKRKIPGRTTKSAIKTIRLKGQVDLNMTITEVTGSTRTIAMPVIALSMIARISIYSRTSDRTEILKSSCIWNSIVRVKVINRIMDSTRLRTKREAVSMAM